VSVKAISEYTAEPMDTVDKFHGMQLVYIYWKNHLMFCASFAFLVDPEMSFESMLTNTFLPAVKDHPDSGKINFESATWLLNGNDFNASMELSLRDNKIDHKSLLTFTTPELNGLNSSAT
tara:strand:+ start:13519 stop:13878 length:360 start_codon:yes stop_codon:yes gene_type:complete